MRPPRRARYCGGVAPKSGKRLPRRARFLLAGIRTALFLGTAAPALAVGPVDFGGSDIVDQAGVLSAGDESKVQSAIASLPQRTGVTLLVAYVHRATGPTDIA